MKEISFLQIIFITTVILYYITPKTASIVHNVKLSLHACVVSL